MILSIQKNKKPLSDVTILNDDLLGGGEILIGRESDCHICLDSFQISRYHGSLKFDGENIVIECLSDYGNIKINGNEVKASQVHTGDKIDIGEYSITLQDLPVIQENINQEEDVIEESFDVSDDVVEEESDSDVGGLELDDEDLVPAQEESENSNEDDLETFETSDSDDLADSDDEFSENNGLELGEEDGVDFENESTQVYTEDDGFGNDSFEENQDDGFGSDGFEENQEDGFGDDGFGDDGFGDDGFGGDSSGAGDATQVFSTFAKYSLKLFGEYAPFDRYTIEEGELLIGRDSEKCQIVLDDDEVSKVHAVIKKTKINCFLEDKDSANGIIHNGERINKVELVNGDEFLIGETTFTVEIRSDIIEAEQGMLMPVEENQEVEIEEIVEEEVDFEGFEGGQEFGGEEEEEKSFIKKIMNDPKKKRIAIIVGVLFLGLMLIDDKPKKTKAVKVPTKKKDGKVKDKDKPKLSAEALEQLEQNYALADAKFNEGELDLAKEYIDIVIQGDPNYKNAQTLKKLIDEGLEALVKLKAKEEAAKERQERFLKVKALVEKAKKAVDEKKVELAKSFFNQIFELDPENIDVPPMKLEIEAYEAEEARKKQDAAQKAARRKGMVDKLKPGKSLYLKRDWYKAIDRLEKFLNEKDMDEDLIKEGTDMLKEARRNLLLTTNPLLSKARSFKEGQDLKQAYETYGEVLKYDPANEEALNERDGIFITLENRSKKIYREALVAESLSLFNKAKEKLQEVQQISPINSEYYNKATDKLKEYLE